MKAKRKVKSKMVKYIHQEDYKNIVGKGEYRENIDILLYCWRRTIKILWERVNTEKILTYCCIVGGGAE